MQTLGISSVVSNRRCWVKATRLFIAVVVLLNAGSALALCNISNVTDVTFGQYDVFLATPVDATGSVEITCDQTPSPTVTVSISASPNSGGFNPRMMKALGLTEYLNYNLYSDKQMTSIWGDGTGGSSVVTTRVPRNKPSNLTIYGRVSALQDVSVGPYSETLTITITW